MLGLVYRKAAEQCLRTFVEVEALRGTEVSDKSFAALPRYLGPFASLAFGALFVIFLVATFLDMGRYGDPVGYWVMGGFGLVSIGLGVFWMVRLKRSRLTFRSGKLHYLGVFKNCTVDLSDVGVVAAGPGDFFLFDQRRKYLFRFPAQFEHIAEAVARVAWYRPQGGRPARFLKDILANPIPQLPTHFQTRE